MKLTAKAYLRIAAEDWHKKYDWVGDFSEGLASVRSPLNRKWGLVNEQGKELIPPKYDSVYGFHEGLAKVKLNDLWGFVNKTGKEVVPLKYDRVENFSEGLAQVRLDGKWSYIDKMGREIPKEYLTAVKLGGDIDRILEIDK